MICRIHLRRAGGALSALVFGLVMAATATAQSSEVPTVDEIVGKLNAAAQGSAQPARKKTRGISLDGTASSGVERVEKINSTSYSETRIQFEFGSDRLTEQSRNVLDVFASAIMSPSLQSMKFVIEGHTDGVGSDQYNLDLSRKRATAVMRYLTSTRGIPAKRLSARGKGKRELANPDEPASAENRRVAWVPLRG